MAKTDTMYMRIEPKLKKSAEDVLSKLGLTSNEAINIFLNQVVLQKGLPFQVKMPEMTKDEALAILMSKIKEAEDSVEKEGWLTVEESKALLGL
jgi:DNA-damage-inducible protein J